jgi:hypothetical protein
MAVTVCKHPESDSFLEMLARGKKTQYGSLTIGVYKHGGVTMSLGMTNLDFVFIGNTNGRYYEYTHSTSNLKIYGVGTSSYVGEIASGMVAACFTSPMFFAIGRD